MKPHHSKDNEITFTTEKYDDLLEVISNCIVMAGMMPCTEINLRHNYVEIPVYSNSDAQKLYDNWP